MSDTHYFTAKRCALLAALFAPLLVQLVWLVHNTQLPVADADEQMQSSYLLYHYLQGWEISKFLRKLYVIRGGQWRPTAYYLVQFPFMLISGGNLMFAVAGATLACTLVTCFYIQRLLCLTLAPWSAALGTALLGLMGIVQWPGTMLGFSESAFLPAVLAACYHLLRSDGMRDAHQCRYMVCATVFAFMVRPVEAAMHLAPIFIVYLCVLWRRGQVTGQVLASIALSALVTFSLLLLAGMFHHGAILSSEIYTDPARGHMFNLLTIAIVALTAAGLALQAGVSLWRYYKTARAPAVSYGLHSFAAIYLAIALFYFPYVTKLVEWVYMCSFGTMALANQRPPVVNILTDYLLIPSGAVPFMAITITGLFSFFFCGKESRRFLVQQPLLYLLCVIPLTLIMVLVSPQFQLRKATVILTVWLLVLLVPALMPGRFEHIRKVLIALLAAIQCAYTLWISLGHPLTQPVSYITGTAAPLMVTERPNPNDVLTDFLYANAVRHHYCAIGLTISTDNANIVDPFLLSALARIRDNPADVSYPFVSAFSDESLQRFLQGKNRAFLLIHDTPGSFNQSDAESEHFRQKIKESTGAPNDIFDFSLALLYSEGKLSARKSECIMLDGLHKQACLFEITTPAPQVH